MRSSSEHTLPYAVGQLLPVTVPRTWPHRLLVLAGLTVSLSAVRPGSAHAQAQYKTNGAAAASTTCTNGFTLTPEAGQTSGSVWRLQQLTLAKSFVFNFSVYLGTLDGNGGDGMVFALQRNSNGTTALGGGGQNMGMAAISPSVSIEFDTYDNGNTIGDIAADHIAIVRNGQFGSPVTFTTPTGGTAQAIPAAVDANGAALNIENGAYYPVKVTWNVKTKTLQVYFNNALRATYAEDFVSTVFSNNPLAYWGFTASTGGAYNKMEACSLAFDYDQDTDGLTDTQDADDDNDGIADTSEAGNVDATADADADGVLNYQDADFGTLNARGVVSSLDADGDGIINQFDLDSDADGIADVVEGTDGKMSNGFRAIYSAADGQYTPAVDASGRPQNTSSYTSLPDTDGDGKPDYLDTNADNDAVPDWMEAFDDNTSGYSSDDLVARAAAFVAAGGNSTYYPSTDANNNGSRDWLDDGNANGIPNFLDVSSTYFHDTDGDGLVDLLDASNLGKGYADVTTYPDRNGNTIPDYRDAAVVTPLPVELVSFTARGVGHQVLLTWVTASELTNAAFVVEASPDGQTFFDLTKVPGAGTTNQRHEYQYTDATPARYASVAVYYRLRQVDTDGQVRLSAVRVVAVRVPNGPMLALPTPFSTQLTLQLSATAAGPAHLEVLTATGKRQLVQEVVLQTGSTTLLVPQAAAWPAGLYTVRITQGQQVYRTKAVRY
ncbi:lectin-like domain-containing protein [Hymenobacter sp. 102]|uniref:lectin-like domain-containing protein n=1 Tax=Hymenobacter sp. 102 TaxID=3403152 RepID=UPI003CF3219D